MSLGAFDPSDHQLSREQAAVVGAFTGVLCGPFSDMHEYVERVMERPVFTHEMASPDVWRQIKDAAESDFLAMCAEEEEAR